MRQLGILGGMSWESTASYYRLLNQGVRFDTGEGFGVRGQPVPQLIVLEQLPDWDTGVAVVMTLYDADDLRGAVKADKTGQAPRGDLSSLQELIAESEHPL